MISLRDFPPFNWMYIYKSSLEKIKRLMGAQESVSMFRV